LISSSTDHTATGTAQDRELLLLDGENIAHRVARLRTWLS
jgi:hypothetical protein